MGLIKHRLAFALLESTLASFYRYVGTFRLPRPLTDIFQLFSIWPVYNRFRRKLAEAHKAGKQKVVPEERLIHAIIGAPALPISIFWMGWTSWPSVSLWSPLAASVVFGFAVMQLYISCYQYIIDSYEMFAASALVGMTLTRYCVVSAFGMT